MNKFHSGLAPQFQAFIDHRKACGQWNESSYEPYLVIFDHFCARNYPDSSTLSCEMTDGWCRKRETESNNSCRSRIYVVISFVRYLKKRGLADIPVPQVPRGARRVYIPHPLTGRELAAFFRECDSLGASAHTTGQLSRGMTIPVFFRLLYSSGMRAIEARMLRRADVDLVSGVMDIRYSKGHSQHYAVLHDSMCLLMFQYDTAINRILPGRHYFFPAGNDSFHSARWVRDNFRQLWDRANTTHAVVYGFRHHYATENINSWGGTAAFDDRLLYLSKSMGHTTVESTRYYYTLVPGISQLLEEKTMRGFDAIVPEVEDEES